jgi:hypothetical protein
VAFSIHDEEILLQETRRSQDRPWRNRWAVGPVPCVIAPHWRLAEGPAVPTARSRHPRTDQPLWPQARTHGPPEGARHLATPVVFPPSSQDQQACTSAATHFLGQCATPSKWRTRAEEP